MNFKTSIGHCSYARYTFWAEHVFLSSGFAWAVREGQGQGQPEPKIDILSSESAACIVKNVLDVLNYFFQFSEFWASCLWAAYVFDRFPVRSQFHILRSKGKLLGHGDIINII